MFLLIGKGAIRRAIRRRVSIPGESRYSQKSIRATCAGGTPLADKNVVVRLKSLRACFGWTQRSAHN